MKIDEDTVVIDRLFQYQTEFMDSIRELVDGRLNEKQVIIFSTSMVELCQKVYLLGIESGIESAKKELGKQLKKWGKDNFVRNRKDS